MKMINDQISGNFTLTEDLLLNGQVTGDVFVPDGLILLLNGQIGGDLIVESGGIATVNGMVVGKTIARGEVIVEGMTLGGIFRE